MRFWSVGWEARLEVGVFGKCTASVGSAARLSVRDLDLVKGVGQSLALVVFEVIAHEFWKTCRG